MGIGNEQTDDIELRNIGRLGIGQTPFTAAFITKGMIRFNAELHYFEYDQGTKQILLCPSNTSNKTITETMGDDNVLTINNMPELGQNGYPREEGTVTNGLLNRTITGAGSGHGETGDPYP